MATTTKSLRRSALEGKIDADGSLPMKWRGFDVSGGLDFGRFLAAEGIGRAVFLRPDSSLPAASYGDSLESVIISSRPKSNLDFKSKSNNLNTF